MRYIAHMYEWNLHRSGWDRGNHRLLRCCYTRLEHSKGKAKRNNTRAIKMLDNKLLSSTQNSKGKMRPKRKNRRGYALSVNETRRAEFVRKHVKNIAAISVKLD